MILIKGGKVVITQQFEENLFQHIERSWFLVNTSCTITESRVWQGIREYNCEYALELQERILELEKKMYH